MKKITRYAIKRDRYGTTLKDRLNDFKPFDTEISCSSANFMVNVDPSVLDKNYPLNYSELLERLKKNQTCAAAHSFVRL